MQATRLFAFDLQRLVICVSSASVGDILSKWAKPHTAGAQFRRWMPDMPGQLKVRSQTWTLASTAGHYQRDVMMASARRPSALGLVFYES